MPLYTYKCIECGEEEDIRRSMDDRNASIQHSCGTDMVRIMSIPQPPIMRATGNDMALASLNHKNTQYMKPEHKMASARGLERPPKTVF